MTCRVGAQIEYSPGGELAGATPAFVPAVLAFVEVMRRWADAGISVDTVHEHVVSARCSAAHVGVMQNLVPQTNKQLTDAQESTIGSRGATVDAELRSERRAARLRLNLSARVWRGQHIAAHELCEPRRWGCTSSSWRGWPSPTTRSSTSATCTPARAPRCGLTRWRAPRTCQDCQCNYWLLALLRAM